MYRSQGTLKRLTLSGAAGTTTPRETIWGVHWPDRWIQSSRRRYAGQSSTAAGVRGVSYNDSPRGGARSGRFAMKTSIKWNRGKYWQARPQRALCNANPALVRHTNSADGRRDATAGWTAILNQCAEQRRQGGNLRGPGAVSSRIPPRTVATLSLPGAEASRHATTPVGLATTHCAQGGDSSARQIAISFLYGDCLSRDGAGVVANGSSVRHPA